MCDKEFDIFKKKFRENILKFKLTHGSHASNCKINFTDYIIPFIRMNREIIKLKLKTFNIFPLRKSFIPHHVTLDTAVLLNLFVGSKYGYEVRSFMDHNPSRKETLNSTCWQEKLCCPSVIGR